MRRLLSFLAGVPLGLGVAILATVSMLRPVFNKPQQLQDMELLPAGATAFAPLASPDGSTVLNLWALPDGRAAIVTSNALINGQNAHVLDPATRQSTLQPQPPPERFWKQVPGRWFTVNPTLALSTPDYHDCTLRLEPAGTVLPVIPECDTVGAATVLSQGDVLATWFNRPRNQTVSQLLRRGAAHWEPPVVLPPGLHMGDLQAGVDNQALYQAGSNMAVFENGAWRVLPSPVVDRLGPRAILLKGSAVIVQGGFSKEPVSTTVAWNLLPWAGLAVSVWVTIKARRKVQASALGMGLGVLGGIILVVVAQFALLILLGA